MSHPTQRRKALALMGAGTLLTTGLLAGLPMQASAEEVSAPTAAGNINPEEPRLLTIHKHVENSSESATPNGQGTKPSGEALAGVTFTLYQLTQYATGGASAADIDLLNDADSWTALSSALGTADNTNNVPSEACTTAVNGSFTAGGTTFTVGAGEALTATDAEGIARKVNPAIGAYLVCETGHPKEVVAPAQPFVVTMPYVYNNDWLYNVHVYPKNGKLTVPTKVVNEQSELGLGAMVSYTITAKVPTLPEDAEALGRFIVKDTLDQKLTPKDPAVRSVAIGDTTFVKDTDYTVTVTGQEVRIAFTEDALEELTENYLGQDVRIVLDTTVTGVGQIANSVEYSAGPGAEGDFISTETPVTTVWGDVLISKIDGKNSAALAGAEFQVFAAADPYASTCATDTKGEAITVNGEDTFTSDENGKVHIAGLFVSSSNTTEGNLDQARCYVLVESKAPAGYVAAAKMPLLVKAGTTEGEPDVTVMNNKQLVPGLPLTGGEGTAAMTGGSLLLGLIAAGAVVRARRKVKA